jgi:hypothetical protein
MKKLQKYISKLPYDVINLIIQYTYNFQNNNLLQDITHYKESKIIIHELYYNYWINYMGEDNNSNEDNYWLINDLFGYTNKYSATMFGYIDEFYKFFQRNLQLLSKEDVNNYIIHLENKEVSTQINVFWGLLTPEERDIFIYSKLYMKLI